MTESSCIILKRPEGTGYKPNGYPTAFGNVSPFYSATEPLVHVPAIPAGYLSPESAMSLAAAIAAVALDVEAGPDPADVEALAEVLHRTREHCDGHGERDLRDARAVLAAGYTPPGRET